MKQCFILKRFNSKFRGLIPQIEVIMETYAGKGYDLTVRQLYYQLVAKNIIENSMKAYKMIVGLLTDARYAGLISWGNLVDRNRSARRAQSWTTAREFLLDVKDDFMSDKWWDQPYHIEVMVEKDALSGIVGPVANRHDVTWTANKGYTSSSAIYKTAQRLRRYHDMGKKVVMLYLGDHDPSGINMTDDIRERLTMLAGDPCTGAEVGFNDDAVPLPIVVRRLALNIDQVKQLNPPENPAKEADSRTPKYVKQFGDKCWELDAVEPSALAGIIESAILEYRDEALWNEALVKERIQKAALTRVAENFGKKKKHRK